jgi:NAD kinase
VAKSTCKFDIPIICINPDPSHVSGVIMKHHPGELRELIDKVIAGTATIQPVTLARASTNDGQELYAVNDFLVGRLDPRAAWYNINYSGQMEKQCSSGVLIAAPMGGTGWIKSCTGPNLFSSWSENMLRFWVREPMASVDTSVRFTHGPIDGIRYKLTIRSEMPEGGVIFSDGMFDQTIQFTTGTEATFTIDSKKISFVER